MSPLDLAGTELAWEHPGLEQADTRYPDRAPLTELLARRLGVGAERVLVTAGSDDALERAFRVALGPGHEALLTRPTFEMLPRFARSTGATVVEAPWPSGPLPVDALIARLTPRTTLIAIVTPNNPTGSVASIEAIRALTAAAPDAMIVVDLAYVEFADSDPTADLLALPRVLITRTLSKAWGLAGLRVGYAAGSAEVIAQLRAASLPYPVATPSLRIAEQALRSEERQLEENVAAVRAVRAEVNALLTSLGTPPIPSQGDFVCLDTSDVPWLRDGLAGLGIGTRYLEGVDTPRLRIMTPPRRAEADRLLEALTTVLAPEAILFDLDGVLADVSRSYRKAILATAERFGVRVTGAEVEAAQRRGGANDDWALTTRLLADAGRAVALEEVTATFESIYQGADDRPGLWTQERLIPPRAFLGQCAARLPLAIVTGRPRGDAERFLAREGLSDLFHTVVTREVGPIKPDPFPVREALRQLGCRRAWMVGDTPDDARAARAAGVLFLGVIAPGDDPSPTADALRAAGAARVLGMLTDLLDLLP